MTIHELAQLAGVSISTVSKVMNNRDAGISAETKQKIQRLAKQYNYVPYGTKVNSGPSHLVGILMGQDTNYALLTGILQQVRSRGYSAIVCNCAAADEELQNYEVLLSHHVDGLIWSRGSDSAARERLLSDCSIPYVLLDEELPEEQGCFFSYRQLAYEAAQKLAEAGHRKIACVFGQTDAVSERICDGVRRCLQAYGTQVGDDSFVPAARCDAAWLQSHTAVICADHPSTSAVAELAHGIGLRIPQDLSMITLCQEPWKIDGAPITQLKKPYEAFGIYAADSIVDRIEGRPHTAPFHAPVLFDASESILPPKHERKQIVVVGAANIDTLISVDHPLEVGKTIGIRHRAIMPGGKGLNQAIGVARLGAAVRLVASLGRDYDGHRILDYLHENRISTDACLLHDNTPTGHAYVYIQKDAASSISVYDGANGLLCADDLERNRQLFEGASYCLLQTEIDQSTALYAAKIAHEHGVRVILKPCVVEALDPAWSGLADILVPNSKEAEKLLPGCGTPEEQLVEFASRGFRTVIITRDEQGCLLLHDGARYRFPAARVAAVDTTGAADGFIAALAVYLAQGASLLTAIPYANCAGGLSTTRYGVPPALVGRDELEIYYSEHQKELQGVEL